ncbi:MAG TPA: DUF4178 domain-containing protein [Labilithrix sp.]|nr:DUF4178 domain-containing protein [Labilithrix sp.]
MRATYEAWTVLELGAKGALAEARFTLVGRTCVRGRRGAIWNEWVLQFEDGALAFLAETSGTFTLYREGSLLPPFEGTVVGRALDVGYVVVARGEGVRVASWGQVEGAPTTYAYAELSSRFGVEATVDFGSDPPRVFVGRKVTLAELGLSMRSAARSHFVLAPEVSRPSGVETWLDVGDEGELEGARLRVVGMLSRSMDVADRAAVPERATWEEYLLFEPHTGMRWLVVADGEWSVVEPIAAGRVAEPDATAAVFDGVAYEVVSEGSARIDWATGELPWEVTIGEESNIRIHARSSWTLTKEWTAEELSWSRSTRVNPEVIAKAFAKRVLPRPRSRSFS